MISIHAIYENGVFRPLAPVDLPESTGVEVVLPLSSGVDPADRVRRMIAEGAAELDRGDVVSAESLFAQMAAQRAQLSSRPAPQT